MYTHCPFCQTYFRVTSEQLKTAKGEVRCGRCYGTFNALDNLVDEPPGPSEKTSSAPEKQAPANTTAPVSIDKKDRDKPAADQSLKREHSKNLISEIQAAPEAVAHHHKRRLLWLLLALPLMALLTLQYAYFNLASLSQNAELRPALGHMCALLDCQLPLRRAPEQIKLVERDIRAHEQKKNILRVSAVMINDADFPQAFPVMQLSMHDITGRVISGRRFQPQEYLAEDNIAIDKGILPGQAIKVELQLLDPGKDAVGFEFEFF